MPRGGGRSGIVRPMHTTRTAGFTLTEVVVALLLASVAGGSLATVLLAEQRLRLIADAEREGARAVREQIELFASRACGADSSGWRRGAWGDMHWSARAVAGAWLLSDSIRPIRAQRAVVVTATTRCAP